MIFTPFAVHIAVFLVFSSVLGDETCGFCSCNTTNCSINGLNLICNDTNGCNIIIHDSFNGSILVSNQIQNDAFIFVNSYFNCFFFISNFSRNNIFFVCQTFYCVHFLSIKLKSIIENRQTKQTQMRYHKLLFCMFFFGTSQCIDL